MSRRRTAANNGTGNAIRGPQSALTDYLAANNISANQIRQDYLARVRATEQEQEQRNATNGETAVGDAADEVAYEMVEELTEEVAEQEKKKNAKVEAAMKKTAKSKQSAKKKKRLAGEPEDGSDSLAWDMYSKSKPLPGQLEHCEICDKRFTVTPYSKEGPRGGLLCTKCSKEQEAEKKKDAKAKKPPISRDKRRKMQSNLLDGIVPLGSKSLKELCVEVCPTVIYSLSVGIWLTRSDGCLKYQGN